MLLCVRGVKEQLSKIRAKDPDAAAILDAAKQAIAQNPSIGKELARVELSDEPYEVRAREILRSTGRIDDSRIYGIYISKYLYAFWLYVEGPPPNMEARYADCVATILTCNVLVGTSLLVEDSP